MSIDDSYPLPAAMPLDAYLRILTENAGFVIDDETFDMAATARSGATADWIAVAGRYAAADYALGLLQRPIAWAREEVRPDPNVDSDDIAHWATWLHESIRTHESQVGILETTLSDFERACEPLLTEALLRPDGIQWQPTQLIPDGLSAAVHVQAPSDAAEPWPAVLALAPVLTELAAADLHPTPSRPVVRRTRYGFNQVDHRQRVSRLLPRRDGWYRMRDFTWHNTD
ncbi:hypothetical protein AB0M46_47445 [Dactylosporangium sp. NPDC051485]|uniref:hypothetical protein n=1 Tax=Dactylosporangium sp. NPDC051485 TaxID=3154846 RepID=UPI003440D757